MEIKAKLTGISLDYKTGLPRFEFSAVEKVPLELMEELKDVILSVSVKKWRRRRSLSQNDYLHVLIGKLADAMNVSKPFMKNFLLRRYGQYDTIDGRLIEFILREGMSDEVDQWETVHLCPTDHLTTMGNGQEYRLFYKLKGSHEMDTLECNKLIDGAISECKEIGIPTDTPQEIERLKALWKSKSGSQ